MCNFRAEIFLKGGGGGGGGCGECKTREKCNFSEKGKTVICCIVQVENMKFYKSPMIKRTSLLKSSLEI